MNKSQNLLQKAWYKKSAWIYLLMPLSWLFKILSVIRKFILVNYIQKKLSVPVIVVGNISVGGTGKTPLIIELVKYLKAQGYKPGVVSRGYGANAPTIPYLLNEASTAFEAGDEPLLIFRSTQCSVCIAPNRYAAAVKLVDLGCNIILSDDGMQHYALARDIEIAVVDGARLFGNEYLLPSGPLREPVSRLDSVDFVVVNGETNSESFARLDTRYSMSVAPLAWKELASSKEYSLQEIDFLGPIYAVAGIGNPSRFFQSLHALNIHFEPCPFPDHHNFTKENFVDFGNHVVLMTEKDAVKCESFVQPNWYSLIVGAKLHDEFWANFQRKISTL